VPEPVPRRAATPKQAHQRADNDEEWRSAGRAGGAVTGLVTREPRGQSMWTFPDDRTFPKPAEEVDTDVGVR
jgi:hypothetical protein